MYYVYHRMKSRSYRCTGSNNGTGTVPGTSSYTDRRKADDGTRWECRLDRRVLVPCTIIVNRLWSRMRWLPYSDTVRVVMNDKNKTDVIFMASKK